MQPRIIVHGGAWTIPAERQQAHIDGVRAAVKTAWPMLAEGADALDAVQAAINLMEIDPTFDAGRGAVLNADGQIELDAAIMDGRTLNYGGVAGVRHFMTPVDIARKVLETEFCLLIAEGAERFARECGLPEVDPRELLTERELELYKELISRKGYCTHDAFKPVPQGTVGAVAMDVNGNIVAATSTGGTPCKKPGRVGDSPLCGAGTYADNETGGASATGFGEGIIRTLMTRSACDYLRDNGANDAARLAIELLHRRVNGHAGLIMLNNKGEYGIFHNTDHMAYAYAHADGTVHASVHMNE
ncbi:isoaspartyl peptidase/L-asparaginase family protein [Oleidesulfovibrio sp.]|uniref:isoaspartyl peptidase/L-asparaginase family protein n=1 Tax=Oleidesulfovibrio sp. TaxID=2909707 RepID=UPI003A8619A2